MRTNLNDSELLKTMKSAKGPLTADQIAKSLGSMRHKVVPLLRGLASSGQIEEVPPTDGHPIRFVFRQKPAGSEQFADNVVNHPAFHRKDEPATAEPKTKAANPKSKKADAAVSSVPKTTPSIEPKPLEAVSQPAPSAAQIKVSIPAPHTQPVYEANSARDKILLMLKTTPMKREDILRELGAMGDLLQEMIQNEEVRSDYIINDYVFELTDKGAIAVEMLATPTVIVSEPVVAQPALVLDEAAPKQPVEVPPVAETPEPVVVAPVRAPAPAPAPVMVAASAAPSELSSLDNPIMQELAKLVEKLVAERLTEFSSKLQESQKDRQKLAQVGAGIKKATAALQMAIDALNEVGNSIAE